MKYNNFIFTKFAGYALVLFLCSGCLNQNITGVSFGDGESTNESGNTTASVVSGFNVMAITVNGSLCGAEEDQYPNEPCVAVTLCQSGTSSCQTIDNILLDTGSFGLRLFESTITVPLNPITSGTGTLAECVLYGDGSSQWGQVETVGVQLGGETAVTMPIQVINSSFSTPPPTCSSAQSTPDTSPAQAGFNGILGVGVWTNDCGSECATDQNNGQYFSCSDTGCSPTTVSLANQVPNPVSMLPHDNNGVILRFSSPGSSGASSLSGSLILGIGTQSNNIPESGLVTLNAAYDMALGNDTMPTLFSAASSTSFPAFIDSGSNFYYIPTPTGSESPDCGVAYGSAFTGFFCPASPLSLSSTNHSVNGPQTSTVSFQVANTYQLFSGPNFVFGNIAGSSGTGSSATFDWGLPFFYGRKVYVGYDSTSSSLGTGPYWAY